MLPTMNSSGDLVVISRMSRSFRRGDVVVATSPTNPRTKLCKRIIGVAGDTVTLLPPGPSPYPSLASPTPSTVVVPPGHVFLQGDNVFNSSDSRHHGPVPTALLMGRVVAKVWPLSDWGRVENTMKWSGQTQWQEQRGEGEGKVENERGMRSRESEREDGVEGIGPMLPGRGGVQVLAESPQAVEQPSRERRTPHVTIIPFTPAPKRERRPDS